MKSSSFPLPNQCFTAEIAICAIQLLLKLQSVKKKSSGRVGGRGKGKESHRGDSRNRGNKRIIETQEKTKEIRAMGQQRTWYS